MIEHLVCLGMWDGRCCPAIICFTSCKTIHISSWPFWAEQHDTNKTIRWNNPYITSLPLLLLQSDVEMSEDRLPLSLPSVDNTFINEKKTISTLRLISTDVGPSESNYQEMLKCREKLTNANWKYTLFLYFDTSPDFRSELDKFKTKKYLHHWKRLLKLASDFDEKIIKYPSFIWYFLSNSFLSFSI